MEHVVRVLDVRDVGAVTAVQDLLWRLMDKDIVQGLLVPMQTHSREAPAPTLVKGRDRLEKANPLAPVMTMNSAKVVGLLLAKESRKRLAAVMRPCEARALVELARQGRFSLDNLLMVSIDCLGSHDEADYTERVHLWGDGMPIRESLRWSRKGQIAPYRYRRACQMCELPNYDHADITIGLFGQNVAEQILIIMKSELAGQIGLCENGWTRPVLRADLANRRKTIENLLYQRRKARQRLLLEIQDTMEDLSQRLANLNSCTLCGECQDACPLTSLVEFDIAAYMDNTPEYRAARIQALVHKAELCTGCGICETVCHMGIPLLLMIQWLAEHSQRRNE